MKVNVNNTIKGLDGQTVKMKVDENKPAEDGTLKVVCVNALMATFDGDEKLSGDKKLHRFMLAEKIYQAEGDVDLKAEEISTIKELIGKAYNVLVVGRAFQLLEGE